MSQQQPPLRPQPNDQTQWNQQLTTPWQQQQGPYNWPTSPVPVTPPQFPKALPQQKSSLWGRYRASKKAQIGSVLLLVLVIVSLLSTILLPQLLRKPIKPDITVDFGSRQNHNHPIHTQFGVAGKDILSIIDQVSNYLPPANITLDNYIVQMENIFNDPNSLTNPAKQDWSTFDSTLSKVQKTFGSNLLLTLQGTPAWLQPQNQTPISPNYCLLDPARQPYPYHAFPTHRTSKGDNGVTLYSQLPALVVAHMDKSFPNIHPNYELWNEPDGYKSWCTQVSDPHADQTRFTWYQAIYAASAPLMEAQARADSAPIKIGGPTLAYYAHFDTWFPKFLNDPKIAPYVDFVTYHQYVTGQTWSKVQTPNSTQKKAKSNPTSLLDATQDPVVGYAAIYQKVSQYVHQGKQPNAQSTPIYISEYNCPAFCRNSPIYAPLWNSLFMADLLNSVNDTTVKYGAAAYLPAGLGYWAGGGATSADHYCMFGMLDANLDCSKGASLQPYPQYYSYLLIGGKHYLSLTDGGYMAAPAITALKGLVIASFYTNTKDNVLIINTSGQAYAQVNIAFKEPGSVQSSASYYLLNQANPHISTQMVNLVSQDNADIATVNVPAYSTIALSVNLSS